MGVTSGCGYWVWLLGVVVRRYIDFLILLTLLLLYLFFFTAAFLLFVHLKNVFRSCSSTFCIITTFYVLNIFFAQYKHTYGQLASHGSHMKAAHTVLYMKKNTQTHASYPVLDISCMSVV